MIIKDENLLQVRLRTVGFVVGPIVFLAMLLFFHPVPERPEVGYMAAVAVAQNVNPLLYMIPATISASMAFMMPSIRGQSIILYRSDLSKE